jgi:hypothetical protein
MTKPKDQRPKVRPPMIGLAALRKSHKMSQVEVAAQVAAIIDQPTYDGGSLSLLEGGHRGASEPVLRALEQVFGLETGSLVTDYAPSHSRRPAA